MGGSGSARSYRQDHKSRSRAAFADLTDLTSDVVTTWVVSQIVMLNRSMSGHWIALKLVGRAAIDAIGARDDYRGWQEAGDRREQDTAISRRVI